MSERGKAVRRFAKRLASMPDVAKASVLERRDEILVAMIRVEPGIAFETLQEIEASWANVVGCSPSKIPAWIERNGDHVDITLGPPGGFGPAVAVISGLLRHNQGRER